MRAGGNAILNQATAKQGSEVGGGFVFTAFWLKGDIYVNNLSFVKGVGVHLSINQIVLQTKGSPGETF